MKRILYPSILIRFILAILLYVPLGTTAQSVKKYPQGYFRWPLNLSPEIVANMGELRSNHWHMGLDVRTAQKVNQPVYAAAEGYIAHVGIRSSGYGRFIIINHPNGLSTLYGHLNDFSPALEAYVTQQQYKQESWAVELDIPKEKFPVSKGAFIAYSGTTGASQGPHVHFEIRETQTGKCLNPLLFGMPLRDNVPPVMVRLAIYDRSKSFYEQGPQLLRLKNTAGGYVLPAPVLKTQFEKISFGLETYDRISGSANQDGIYSARLFLDDQLQVEFIIDSISYTDTRYMNAQIDYKYKENGGSYLQHLSMLPGDKSGVYHPAAGDGTIWLEDTMPHRVRIETEDGYKNISSLNFLLQRTTIDADRTAAVKEDIFIPNTTNVLEKPDFEAVLSPDCLYDTVTPVYHRTNSSGTYAVSALHRLNDETTPLHEAMTIRIKPDKIIPDQWRNKMVIRHSGNGSAVRAAQWQGNWLTASFADFGSFQAFADVTPPTLAELGKGDTVNLSASSRIIFAPSDNSGIKKFRAELDDQWLRFTNDKSRSWIYIFDERCPYGVHKLKVTVEDLVGNITTKTWWFKKYAYTPPKKKPAAKKKTTTKKKAPVKKKK